MAWTKIPAAHHPLFLEALPKDPRISTMRMFGGIVAMVNGHMASGLFARSVIVKLSPADRAEALALDGSAPFDPMGHGRVVSDTILLAEEVMDEPPVLRDWLRRSFEHALTLPRKAPKSAARSKPAKATKTTKATKAKPAKRPAASAAKRPATKQPAARTAKPWAAKTPGARPSKR